MLCNKQEKNQGIILCCGIPLYRGIYFCNYHWLRNQNSKIFELTDTFIFQKKMVNFLNRNLNKSKHLLD